MKNLIFIFIFITGCNGNENNKNTALETFIKKTTDVEVDFEYPENSEKNKADIAINDNGLNLKERFNNGFATISVNKEVISITITNEENGLDHLLIGFTNNDFTQLRPIKGKLNKDGDNSMSFSTVNYKDNQMDMMTGFIVEGEIISLKPEKIVIKLKGEMGYTIDSENPDKWKKFEGVITLNVPIFQALGNTKDEFVY